MKNILLFMSPFIFVGLFLILGLIFGKGVGYFLIFLIYSILVIGFLSLLGSILVDNFGD